MKEFQYNYFNNGKDRLFWDILATKYPDPFDVEIVEESGFVIRKVKEWGVELRGATVLDIGCGTGIHSIPISKEASKVVAMDFSMGMISRMVLALRRSKIKNIHVVCEDFKHTQIDKNGFENGFDIVWASMTPAVSNIDYILLMERCAKKWCVYIGWGNKRENAFLKDIFAMHDLNYAPPKDLFEIYMALVKLGRKPRLSFFETSWTWQGNIKEAYEYICAYIETENKIPKKDKIKSFLKKYQKNGFISYTTYAEQGILVWRPTERTIS